MSVRVWVIPAQLSSFVAGQFIFFAGQVSSVHCLWVRSAHFIFCVSDQFSSFAAGQVSSVHFLRVRPVHVGSFVARHFGSFQLIFGRSQHRNRTELN